MSQIFTSKSLRDEMMAAAAPFRARGEKSLTTIHQKHGERAQTRIGLPVSAEDIRRSADRYPKLVL